MTPIEIVSVVMGYIYFFISIFISVIKLVYIFLKNKIMPNLILYYLLKTLSGFSGILYGLTFLDKLSYYLITPFISVFLLDFIVLGVVCVVRFRDHINQLKKVHPISNAFRVLKSDSNRARKRSKSEPNLSTIKDKKPLRRRSSESNLLIIKDKKPLRRTRSDKDLKILEEDYMVHYIANSLGRRGGIESIKITNKDGKLEQVPKKNTKSKKLNKSKKKKKKKTDMGDMEDMMEEEMDDLEEEMDDLEEEMDDDDTEEEEDENEEEEDEDEEEEDEDEDEDEEQGGGIISNIIGSIFDS